MTRADLLAAQAQGEAMTAPSALDRAARALLANMAATGTSVTITLDAANLEAVDINGCFDARAMVRAVLAALAEPTPGMVEALRRVVKVNTGCVISATTASFAISEVLAKAGEG